MQNYKKVNDKTITYVITFESHSLIYLNERS
jgi:hypothetical protein